MRRCQLQPHLHSHPRISSLHPQAVAWGAVGGGEDSVCTLKTLILVLILQMRKLISNRPHSRQRGLSHRVISNRTGTGAQLCRLPGYWCSCLSPINPFAICQWSLCEVGGRAQLNPASSLSAFSGEPSYTLVPPSLL